MAADGSYLSSRFPPSSRWFAGFSLIFVVLTVGAVAMLLRHPAHLLRSSACFQDVNGLRSGASVRIAGVDVGQVRAVRAHPGNSACPAEVGLELGTAYALNLPSDAVASVSSSGIPGRFVCDHRSDEHLRPAPHKWRPNPQPGGPRACCGEPGTDRRKVCRESER